MKDFKLEKDELIQLKTCWDTMNTSSTSETRSNNGMIAYMKKLTSNYDIKSKLMPKDSHLHHSEHSPAYHHFQDYYIIFYWKKERTIVKTRSSRACKNIMWYLLETNGFKIFTYIIYSGNAQLVAKAIYLIKDLSTLI